MTEREIKYSLNKFVNFRGGVYKLTGATIRLNDNGYYYQAELQDKNENSIAIARLEEVEGIINGN